VLPIYTQIGPELFIEKNNNKKKRLPKIDFLKKEKVRKISHNYFYPGSGPEYNHELEHAEKAFFGRERKRKKRLRGSWTSTPQNEYFYTNLRLPNAAGAVFAQNKIKIKINIKNKK
jgi:hypothetical protein